ncbi:DUF721 domain-containing protein [Thermoleophilia bacterium SCSIO 60948]|nr:DUF721 domain-containing protein [Thermoleophilia bacterium SCSIO 60948]
MSERGPRRLGMSLGRVTPDIAPATPLARIQAVWEEAAGRQVASNASPVALREDVLIVACSSAAWAQELELMQTQLAAALAERLPDEDRIASFRFRVGERP